MFHFTMFGGAEVRLDGSPKCIITIFGGTDIRRQTLAKRILRERHYLNATAAQQGVPGIPMHPVRRPRPGCFLLTLFGGAEFTPPSIAEEFMDMRELMASGIIRAQEWDALVARLHEQGEHESHASFTMFGALEDSTLNEQEEAKKIQSARELGIISEEEEFALRGLIGRDPHQVRLLLRQTAFA